MDKYLREEVQNLDKTKSRLNKHSQDFSEELKSEEEEMRRGSGSGSDDYESFIHHKVRVGFLRSEIEKLNEIIPNPYFARIDFYIPEDETDIKVNYIGYNEYSIGLDNIIRDWRGPYGDAYYQKNQTNHTIGNTEYNVSLRRALSIQDGNLSTYKNEYILGEIEDAEIVDPFLIDILRAKRKDKAFTNIIQSIQQEQFQIINLPINENVIVQGCAGSGKTMILTHRISSLIYKNPTVSSQDFIIVSPSTLLNIQIDNLSHSLDIDNIPKYTVEEFYQTLYSTYQKQLKDNTVFREKLEFSEKFKSYLFSDQFKSDLTYSINNKYNILVNRDYIKEYKKVLKQMDKFIGFYPFTGNFETTLNDSMFEDFDTLLRNTKVLREYFKALISEIEELSNELNETIEGTVAYQLKHYQTLLSSQNKELKELRENIKYNLTSKQVGETQKLVELKAFLQQTEHYFDFKKELKTELSKQEYLQALHHLDSVITMLKSLDLDKLTSKKLTTLSDTLQFDTNTITNLSAQLKTKDGFFQFMQRNSLKAKISNIQEQIETRFTSSLSILETIVETQIEDVRKLVFKSENYIEAISELLNSELNFDLDNIDELVDSDDYERFELLTHAVSDIQDSIDLLEPKLEQTTSTIKFLKSAKLDDKVHFMSTTYDSLENVQKPNIEHFNVFIHNLFDKKYDSSIFDFLNYQSRESLYAKLLYSLIEFGDLKLKRYIFIDEGQTLTKNEYELIWNLVSNESVLNIYGDINQSVYPSTNLGSWDEIMNEDRYQFFELKRNYRNPIQITEFTNNEFGLDIKAIGLESEEVLTLNADQIIQELKKLRLNDPDERTAILLKNSTKFKMSSLYTSLKNNDLIKEKLSDSLAIIDISDAKGLEFENVFVFTDSLERNERYIAYTRALNRLYIVNSF